MRTAAPWLAVALIVAAPAAPAAHAQAPGGSARWTALVEAHVPGELDDAVLEAAGGSRHDTASVVPPSNAETLSTAFLHRALLFHTDVAIAQRVAFDLTLSPGLSGKVLIVDPTDEGVRQRAVHWAAGRVIAALLAKRSDGAATARRWFEASSALLFELGDLATLAAHLDEGADRFRDEPFFLLLRGTFHQGLADGRVQGHARRLRAHARNALRANFDGIDGEIRSIELARRSVVTGDVASELARAEAAFRDTIRRDASLHEARVRMAHVLERQGRTGDALDAIAPALAGSLSAPLEYYAAMLVGRCELRHGRIDAARTAFERAARAVPAGQAARIALSRLAIAEGRAADALDELTALDDDAPSDPWWGYLRLHEPGAKALLASLREGL